MTFDLDVIQKEQYVWAKNNFANNQNADTAFMGMVEELGELAHSRLKAYQGIRAIDVSAEKDAIGDLLIYLLNYCSTKNWFVSDILQETWNEVKQRDWVKYPTNGVSN